MFSLHLPFGSNERVELHGAGELTKVTILDNDGMGKTFLFLLGLFLGLLNLILPTVTHVTIGTVLVLTLSVHSITLKIAIAKLYACTQHKAFSGGIDSSL